MTLPEINQLLRQRPPFQMVERVLELKPYTSAIGIKAVSVNEPYFSGHFPEAPIMPGVLLVECAAQLCSLVMASDSNKERQDKLDVLLKIKEFKFIKPVIPGDILTITVNKTKEVANAFEFSAVIQVDDTIKAKGLLLFTAMNRSDVYE